MSVSSLPLQIRAGIRDLYDSKDAALNRALDSLNKTVGLDFSVSIAWVDMFRDVGEKFPDKSTLVPSIVEIVSVFIKRLERALDDNEEFQDRFLEEVGSSRVNILVSVHDSPNPIIVFIESRVFNVFLPALDEQGYRSLSAIFGDDITKIFDPSDPQDPRTPHHSDTTPQPAHGLPRPSHVHALPSLKSLSRPETLFSHTLPYTLLVRRTGARTIEIEGNHGATLELLAGYFEKYARKSVQHSDGSPYFDVEKTTSPFGSGNLCDMVRIKSALDYADWLGTGLTMVLAFAEGICGYEFVSSSDGQFFFRRAVPFRAQ